MAEAQQMKLTEIFSDFLVKEEDNLKHMDKTVSPPEENSNRQNMKTESIMQSRPNQLQTTRNTANHHLIVWK